MFYTFECLSLCVYPPYTNFLKVFFNLVSRVFMKGQVQSEWSRFMVSRSRRSIMSHCKHPACSCVVHLFVVQVIVCTTHEATQYTVNKLKKKYWISHINKTEALSCSYYIGSVSRKKKKPQFFNALYANHRFSWIFIVPLEGRPNRGLLKKHN